MAAFRLALEQGADGVELDVALSRDCVPVVMHDDLVDRTTNGSGRVDQLTLAELRQLEASLPGKFGAKYAGERIPTLEEAFLALPPTALVNVELKRDTSPRLQMAAEVAEVIRRLGREKQVWISSFHYDNLQRVHRLAPSLPLGLLHGPNDPLRLLRAGLWPGVRAQGQHPYHLMVRAVTVRWWHWLGFQVNVWTVDSEADLRRVMRLGVDGVITNNPDVAVRVRQTLANEALFYKLPSAS